MYSSIVWKTQSRGLHLRYWSGLVISSDFLFSVIKWHDWDGIWVVGMDPIIIDQFQIRGAIWPALG